jgi:hypothetical protein
VRRECSSDSIARVQLDKWLTLLRNATLRVNQPAQVNGLEAADLSQIISGIPVGDSYYVTAQVNRLGWDGYCVFDMLAGSEVLARRTYFFDQQDSCEAFHANGVSASADTDLFYPTTVTATAPTRTSKSGQRSTMWHSSSTRQP